MKFFSTLAILFFSVSVSFAQIPTPGNVLWLKADAAVFNDAGVTAATNGQTVQQWNDQSGNSNHVTQTVAASKPVFQTAQIGGQPAIFFDGAAGAKYLSNTISNLVTAGAARTTFIVSKINAASTTGGTIFTFRRTASINSLSLGLNAGVNYVYTDGVTAANNASAPASLFTDAKNPFIATYSNGIGSQIGFRFNGIPQTVSQVGTVSTETGTAGFTVGGREDYASWWQGLIAEIIVYNRTLTVAEIQQVESYLQTKYTIASPPVTPRPGSGTASRLNGSTQYINIPDDNSLDFGSGDFTVQCWVKKNALSSGSNNVEVINKWTDGTATSEWWLGSTTGSGDNIPSFYWQVGGTYSFVNATTTLALNKWNHLSVTRVGPTISLYVNGILEGTGNIGTNTINNVTGRNLLMAARNSGSGNYSAIDIDEVQIYKGAGLNQTTIRDWMCKKITPSHPDYANLVSYYRFDEGTGTSLSDLKGTNHGALINAPAWVTSGAALGDVSTYDYSGNTSTANINFGLTGADNLTATLNAGTAAGVQVYGVNERANTMTDVDSFAVNNRYGGVFVVNGNAGAAYNAVYSYGSNPNIVGYSADTLGLYKRSDNAATAWSMAAPQTNNTTTKKITATGQNTEYVLGIKLNIPVPVAPTCYGNFIASGNLLIKTNTANSNSLLDNNFDNFTYEFWANPTQPLGPGSTSGDQYIIFPTQAASVGRSGIGIGVAVGNNGIRVYGHTAAYLAVQLGYSYTFTGWTHIAVVYTAQVPSIYINGLLVATGTANGTARADDSYLGANYYGQYIGSTTDFRLWNYARTATQIALNLNTPPAANSAGLQTMIGFNNLYNGAGQLVKNTCTNLPLLSLDKITAGSNTTPQFNCNGTTFPALASPTCGIKLNGTSRVDVGNLGAMPDKGTIEFWMNQPSFSDWQMPVTTLPIGGSIVDGIYFQSYATGQLIVGFGNAANNQVYTSYGNLTANRSYHVAVTWDITAGTYKGYLDGRLIFVQPLTYYPTTLPRLTLGAGFVGGRYYNGSLDEVRYWNTERTQSEIVNNATGTLTGSEAGLQAYYHFNENMLNGNGQTILNKATITGATLNGTTVNYVKFPCSLNPPTCGITVSGAAGEGVQIPNNTALNLTSAFTYQTWIKASTDVANYRCIFSKGAFATAAPTLMIAGAGAGANAGKLNGYYYIGATLFSFVTPTTVNDNEWHHIAYTYDGANMKIYIDGVLDFTQAATGVLTTNTSPLSIGYNFATGNYPFIGKMDEFSIWNIARTQTDIQNTMNSALIGNETGLAVYYHFNDNTRSGQNRTVTNFCTTTGSALNGLTYGTSLIPVFDCAPPPFAAPECNMQTNGTTDQVTVPNNAALGLNNFSIGTYVKTTDASGNYKNILWKDVDGSNANYALYITNTNKAQVTFQRNPIAGQAPNATGITTITDGNWHYLVGTYDGTNLKIYVDGILDGTTATSSTPMTGSNPLYLASSAGSNKYNGSMDEISVWNRALSATEITGLIGQRLVGNETGLVAYYNFGGNTKNGQGIIIANSCTATGSALNGTTVGTTTTPIFTCSEIIVTPPACNLLMNGYSDHAYVNGTGAMSYPGVTNNFTMEVKAKALYPKGNASGAQYDGVYSGQNFVLFPDQGGDGFAPGHAGVGISLGTNGVAVYEHSTNYIPARIIFNNYNTNDWVNLTVVSSNGLLKLYINGALVSTASASGYILHPSGHIGGYYGTFAGYVGEVRIWNAALTGDQIRTNLNATLTGSETNLISLFKFNNNTSNGTNKTITGLGSFGSANPYITNGTSCTPIFTCANTTSVNRDDMVGSGSMLNQNGGGVSFAELGDLGNIPAQGSMMLWFNGASLKEKAFVFSSAHFRNSVGRYKGINLFTRSDGKLQLTFGTDTTALGYQDTVTVATNIIAGRWNHFAMSWDTVAKTYTTYVNGIQTATGSTNFWPAQLESFKAGIGLQPSSTYAWNGQIDELSEWNKILSLTEIRNQLASKINSSQSNYANLLHYYRFDNNTCGGNSLSDYKGTVHGMIYNTSLPTSSAPIGAYSSYQYAGNTSATSLQIGNGQGGTDNVTATINTGTANGIHLYGEDNWPNTVTGVNDTVPGSKRYAGVYMVNPNAAAYTLLYDYTNNPYVTPVNEPYLRLRKRDNNAVTTWGTPITMVLDETLNTVTCTGESTEYILAKGLFPLPLKWLSFTAQLNNNKQTLLNWKVSAEFNVSRYEIEWSRDGIHFTLIATTGYNAGAGGNYAAIHVQPVNGNNYYRIKQVDVDGRYSYTNIQLIKLTDNMEISVYPNPAKDVLNILGWDKIKQMQLYDISGRKLSEWKTAQSTIRVDNLANGTYVLKAELRSGEMIEQKLIVSK